MSGDGSALSDLRVIEMGSFIAGPFAGQLLADLGADVVKIEPPSVGDAMRQWGLRHRGKSLWWPVIARNKLSVTLDLRREQGQAIARRLIEGADVLIENFRHGALERWNLDPATLRAANERLIVCRVSGFGQTGPSSAEVGFGAVAEARAGMRHLNGFPDRPPPRTGLSIGDSLTGLFAALGVLAAVSARHRTGKGQIIDIGITDSVLAVLESVISEYSVAGATRQRTGSTLPGIAPSNLYPTRDGERVLIASNSDGVFRRLAKAMDRSALAQDTAYATHQARGERQTELDEIIAQWTSGLGSDELLAILRAHDVPAGRVNDVAAVVKDAHFRERGALIEVETDDHGRLLMQAVAPRLSETPGSIRWPGAALGEHTDRVLSERLNVTPQDLRRLREEGVI